MLKRTWPSILLLSGMLLTAVSVRAVADAPTTDSGTTSKEVDLTKIKRFIGVEPKYKAAPRYCMLVFGERAEEVMWLVVDKDLVHISRPTATFEQKGKRDIIAHFKVRPRYSWRVHSPTRKSTIHIVARNNLDDATALADTFAVYYNRQSVGGSQNPAPVFSETPETAPVIHFDGPMQLVQYSTPLTLKRGHRIQSERDAGFRVMLVTPGLGPNTLATHSCRVCSKSLAMKAQLSFQSLNENGIPVELTQSLKKSG